MPFRQLGDALIIIDLVLITDLEMKPVGNDASRNRKT